MIDNEDEVNFIFFNGHVAAEYGCLGDAYADIAFIADLEPPDESDDDFNYNYDSALDAGFGTSEPDANGRGRAFGW